MMLLAWLVMTFTFCWIAALIYVIWRNLNYPEEQALLARCEQQHQLWMKGDSRGFYGEYPPAKLDADGLVVMPVQLPSVGTRALLRPPFRDPAGLWPDPTPYNPDEHPYA